MREAVKKAIRDHKWLLLVAVFNLIVLVFVFSYGSDTAVSKSLPLYDSRSTDKDVTQAKGFTIGNRDFGLRSRYQFQDKTLLSEFSDCYFPDCRQRSWY